MALFGTDGIRGTPGKSPLTPAEIWRIAAAFSTFLGKCPRIIACRDTRKSGKEIQEFAAKGLLSAGAEVLDLGVLGTPAAAYLAREVKADGCLIASASHNPAHENGLKFLTGKGTKLTMQDEERIEQLFLSGRFFKGGGKAANAANEKQKYAVFAAGTAQELSGIKLVLDCANGAAYETAPAILRKTGASVITINAKPDGKNINRNCGSEHPEQLAEAVRKKKADIGIGLDGDGDRAAFVDETGTPLSGDEAIGILAISLAKQGRLPKSAVAVTHYSNYGLEKSLQHNGIAVVRTDVGDQKIAEAIMEHGLGFGAEQSGHMIFQDTLPTGDGTITAIQMLNTLRREGLKLSELKAEIESVPQKMISVEVREKKPLDSLKLHREIAMAEEILKGQGRVLVRYSGTQSLIRIMVEGKSESQINKIAHELAEEAKRELA